MEEVSGGCPRDRKRRRRDASETVMTPAWSCPLPTGAGYAVALSFTPAWSSPRLEAVLSCGTTVSWNGCVVEEQEAGTGPPAPPEAPEVVHSPCGMLLAAPRGLDVRILLHHDVPEAGEGGVLLRGHTGDVLCAAFSPSGRLLVTGAADSTLRVWSTSSGRAIQTWSGGGVGNIWSVVFSPCGRLLACGGAQRAVSVFRFGGG